MTRRLRALIGVTLLVAGGLAAAPAALAGDPCFHGYAIPASTTAAVGVVNMEPCAFVPTNVRTTTGTTLTFTNGSGEVHLLTGANQAWGDREQEILPGASVTVRFDEPGVYAFSCALHRGMSGAVIVEAADQAGAAPVSSSGAGSDGGLVASLAIAGLATLAAIGWAAALVQRRRVVAAEAARATATARAATG